SKPWLNRNTTPWYSPFTFSKKSLLIPPCVTSPCNNCPAKGPSFIKTGSVGELPISASGSQIAGGASSGLSTKGSRIPQVIPKYSSFFTWINLLPGSHCPCLSVTKSSSSGP